MCIQYMYIYVYRTANETIPAINDEQGKKCSDNEKNQFLLHKRLFKK